MCVMFGSAHIYSDSGEWLSEPFRFNLYLGSGEMLLISTLLASAVLVILFMKKHRTDFNFFHNLR
jgi:hypothetical protein